MQAGGRSYKDSVHNVTSLNADGESIELPVVPGLTEEFYSSARLGLW